LVDRPGDRIFGPTEALHRPLGLGQHGRRRIFLGVLRQAERLGKAEAAEIMVEASVVGLVEQRYRLLLSAPKSYKIGHE
jgi:hypothetical protein